MGKLEGRTAESRVVQEALAAITRRHLHAKAQR